MTSRGVHGNPIQEVLSAPPAGCQTTNLSLTAAQTTSARFETAGSITSSQAISGAGTLVEYEAAGGIGLSTGFAVGPGVELRAGSTGCATP